MGCGKSTEQVTPAFVSPTAGEKKPFSAVADPMQPTPNPPDAINHQRQSLRPHRNSDLTSLYPPLTKKAQLRLEFVYGYQSRLAANNAFYMSSSDIIIYPCASLVVLLSLSSNTQRFLGGGEVHFQRSHFGKVAALALNQRKDLVASGELATLPVICVWRMPGSEPHLILQLGAETVGVDILSFSFDSKFLASVDMTPEQNIRVFELQNGNQVFAAPSKPGKLRALAWSPRDGCFCTGGDSHAFFWTHTGQTSFGREKADREADVGITAIKWFPTGECLMGGQNGMVYKWNERKLVEQRQILPSNVRVSALFIDEESILVGSQDWKIHILTHTFHSTEVIDTPGAPLSLDVSSGSILCGTDESILLEFGKNGRVVVMDVHSQSGQYVCVESANRLLSVGGDNKIKTWDLGLRKCTVSGLLEITNNPSKPCAIAISSKGHVAVGHKDGHFTVRGSTHQLNNILLAKRENKATITVMKYSPDGTVLAVGTETGSVLLYNPLGRYSLIREIKGQRGAIVTLDWSENSVLLRVQDNTLALYYWKTGTGESISDVSHETWSSDSIIHSSASTTTPLVAAKAKKSNTFAQGTEYGVVEIITPGTDPQATGFKAHTGAVRGLLWSDEDQALYSVGEEDCCIMQWKFTP